MAFGAALGDFKLGDTLPGAIAPATPVTPAQPQVTTVGVPRLAERRGPLDILLDGIPFKLFVEEPRQGSDGTANAGQAYSAEEIDPLLPRLASQGPIGYGDFPTKDEIVVAQDNWTAGLSPVREQRVDATYWSSVGVDARRPLQLLIQPQKFTVKAVGEASLAGPPVEIVDCFGGVFMIAGNTLYSLLLGSPPSWKPVLTAAAAFSDLAQYANLLLAAVSGGNGYYYSSDGASWTQVTGSGDGPKADLFSVVRFQLYKAVKPNKIYITTDPTNPANWNSTPTQVGDTAHQINSLAPFLIDIAIGKEDGVWTVDRAGNDFPIVPELRSVANAANALTMKQWRSGLHFRVRNGLYRYDGRLLSIGLDRYRAPIVNGLPLVLSVADTAPYTNEMLAALQIAGQQGLYLASLYEAPWRWHLWGFDARFKPTCLAVSANAFATPTLWVGQDDGVGGYSTGYVRLPAATDNPLDDPGYTFQPGSWPITLDELAPLPDQEKNWCRVIVRCPKGSLQATLGMAYAVDGDIDTQTFTRMVGPQGQLTQFGLQQEWFFADPKGVNGRALQLQLILATSDPAQSPAPRHVVVHFKHMAFPRNRFTVRLVCEDHTAGQDHQRDERSAEDHLLELVRIRTAKRPVEFVDIMGLTRTVYLERLDHRLLDKGPDQQHRFIAICQMLEFTTTMTPAGPPQDAI